MVITSGDQPKRTHTMVARFLVFAWSDQPTGGLNDYVCVAETVEEATIVASRYQHGQVVDLHHDEAIEFTDGAETGCGAIWWRYPCEMPNV